jgi:hypothetical protein
MSDEQGEPVPDLASLLRQAIRADGRSLRRLAKDAGDMDGGRLSRFLSGDREINLNGAGRLFDALGVTVTFPPPKRGVKKGTPKPGRPKGKTKRNGAGVTVGPGEDGRLTVKIVGVDRGQAETIAGFIRWLERPAK